VSKMCLCLPVFTAHTMQDQKNDCANLVQKP